MTELASIDVPKFAELWFLYVAAVKCVICVFADSTSFRTGLTTELLQHSGCQGSISLSHSSQVSHEQPTERLHFSVIIGIVSLITFTSEKFFVCFAVSTQ
jgi:hypothetical protein